MQFPQRKQMRNPEWADYLKRSIPFLWDGSETPKPNNKRTFICFALSCLPDTKHKNLVEEIANRIRPYVLFHEWYRCTVNSCPTTYELQQARLAWVNDMIEEFS